MSTNMVFPRKMALRVFPVLSTHGCIVMTTVGGTFSSIAPSFTDGLWLSLAPHKNLIHSADQSLWRIFIEETSAKYTQSQVIHS